MKRDAKRIAKADDEAQVSAAKQLSDTATADVGPATEKGAADADWLSMATGDPALYIKETE